jgi:DNA-binding CsgD family transcriptional regulator
MVMRYRMLEEVFASMSDVVVDPTRWKPFLEEMAKASGSVGVAILPERAGPDILVGGGMEDAFRTYVAEGWDQHDPRRRAISIVTKGRVATDSDISTDEAMARDPYYSEFLPRFGLRWWAGVGFRSGRDLRCLAFQRAYGQGRFVPEEIAMLETFLPRVGEIATLAAAVGRAAVASVANALDLLPLAAFAVDSSGRVVCVNASAEELFCRVVGVRKGKLHIGDPQAAAECERLLLRLKVLPEGSGLGADPVVVRRGEEPPMLLRFLPIDGAVRNPFSGADALVVMTVVGAPPEPALRSASRIFGLTPAETRLAGRLATGSSVGEAADRLGISKQTARNQLKAIFGKTDTHRQSQLVALLGRLPSQRP